MTQPGHTCMSRSDAPARWQAIWAGRGWRARLLWPLSQVYGLLSAWRRRRYLNGSLPVATMPVPVIVVGNVVVGGAGKTPTTLAVLEHLKNAGWRPGVVSRGHGRQGHAVLEVRPDTTATDGGDEPVLIRRKAEVPVFVGRRRADAARALLAAHPQVNVLVCDDGLQHLALGRDVSIAVFDDRGLGNGWLLPAGLLREPWPPAAGDPFAPQLVLRQGRHDGPHADIPMPPATQGFSATRRLADQAVDARGARRDLRAFAGETLVAVAGIARPEVFFQMLREQGLELSQTVALPDHADAKAFAALPRSASATVLCTEKDAVKLFNVVARWPASQRPAVWSIPLDLRIEPAFFEALDRRLAACGRSGRLSSADGHETA
ncbi:tetraacyldisaccharide 4'-kinase [Hydrogenophaga sp. RWCD_12]|uniref:tetraacyldisaccharide 4'-kinase n=1 Tax=Hydrogenophaga sp. RWCD_12 TaxID=3391190 RepID=UPI0039855B8F